MVRKQVFYPAAYAGSIFDLPSIYTQEKMNTVLCGKEIRLDVNCIQSSI